MFIDQLMGSVEDSDTLGLYHMPIYPCKHGTLSPALMLGQRCRQWANNKWTLRQRLVFVGLASYTLINQRPAT